MWEQQETPGKRMSAPRSGSPFANSKFSPSGNTQRYQQRPDLRNIPPELLILNRFGIGYPYLKAAQRLSSRWGIDGCEILFRTGVISREIWLASQNLLIEERLKKKRQNNNSNRQLTDYAVNHLHRSKPHYSAGFTWTNGQVIVCVIILAVCFTIVASGSHDAIFILTSVLSLFYMTHSIFRIVMVAWYDCRFENYKVTSLIRQTNLPKYTVLVALYQEANQVESLIYHLSKLDWPKNLLEIKLICEQNDPETISRIETVVLPANMELVIVPTSQPQTKPKALNFALPLCTGDYLVVYDAEDRPSPGQLREAYNRFLSETDDLACLQAPLAIHNGKQNWLTALFTIEYNTLFLGILPVLAYWNAPLPLGGTSNHFKTEILRKIGGWDPYNVTEDADLGMRLAREGYRVGVIKLPTYEEAPPKLIPWIKQRTRWIKGWMQTILVHTRMAGSTNASPSIKIRIFFHLLMTLVVLSSLIHPFILGALLWYIDNLMTDSKNTVDLFILTIALFNLMAGYTSYGMLAYLALKENNMGVFVKMLPFLPLYWILISMAGWRALYHLLIKPHRWEKTPHGLCETSVARKTSDQEHPVKGAFPDYPDRISSTGRLESNRIDGNKSLGRLFR